MEEEIEIDQDFLNVIDETYNKFQSLQEKNGIWKELGFKKPLTSEESFKKITKDLIILMVSLQRNNDEST